MTSSAVATRAGKLAIGVVVLAAIATLGGLPGGPPLNEHEAMVAECGRNMRLTGDWLVPRFLDAPWLRKPPLPYWLVASTSYLLPGDPKLGLPVTTLVSRLPSALAGLGTVLLIWRLGAVMFTRRVGLIAAVISASSLVFLQYSPNATVEMLLTFSCTWALLHFWMAAGHCGLRIANCELKARHGTLHMLGFYVALGVAMLAKGPAPLAMVAFPLAVWWYLERPLRVLARGGWTGLRRAPAAFIRGLKPRTVGAFRDLWLVPGLIVFALLFVPWMIAVAYHHPHAWDLWNWQYAQRAQGDYLDDRARSPFYYIPVIIGFSLPWLFLLPEALAAPWLPRYARMRRALFFCGVCAVVGIVIMSIESFKKPYYMLPAMPLLFLMMAVVADRFYAKPPPSIRLAWVIWGVAAAALAAGVVIGGWQLHRFLPDITVVSVMVAALSAIALLIAGIAYIRGRGWIALGMTACTGVAAFLAVWHVCGPVITNLDRVEGLARALDRAGVPPDGKVLWADTRPDPRLIFCFRRRSDYLIPPAEIVTIMVEREGARGRLRLMALDRAEKLLKSPEPVYLILKRDNYDLTRVFNPLPAHLIGIAKARRGSRGDDWVIVSNVQPATRPGSGASSPG